MPNAPFSPPRLPGVEDTRLVEFTPNGPSPQVAPMQLPGYGVYLATIRGRFGNQNNTAMAVAIIHWFKYEPSGGSAALLSESTVLSSAIAGPPGSGITGITVADPTTAGVVDVGLTWADGSNKTCWVSWSLRTLMNKGDLERYPG